MYAMIRLTWTNVVPQTRCFPLTSKVCMPCFIGGYLSGGYDADNLYEFHSTTFSTRCGHEAEWLGGLDGSLC